MNCPICTKNILRFHVSIEPRRDLNERREVNRARMLAIECQGGCLIPVGGAVFKAIEMTYWATERHAEYIGKLESNNANAIMDETRRYNETMALLKQALNLAVRRSR